MSRMKRALENNSDEESSKTTPENCQKEIDKKTSEDDKYKDVCSLALKKQDMDSSTGVVPAHFDTLSNQEDTGGQDTVGHANRSHSGDALDPVTVSGAILSRPTVSSDLIHAVSQEKSMKPGSLDNEIGRAISGHEYSEADNVPDSRLRELLLEHLQNFIDNGEGPYAPVKKACEAALRYYNSYSEHFQKLSADLERACARLSEPSHVVEIQHSASDLNAVSTQMTHPGMCTVATQFSQTEGPPMTMAVCALCGSSFHIKNSLFPTSSFTQRSKNSLENQSVIDLTVDEMADSPSQNVPPTQFNEAKPVTPSDPDLPYVSPSITSLTTGQDSLAFVSTVSASSGSNPVVTASTFAVAGATTTSVISALSAAMSLQSNNALTVTCNPAPPKISGISGKQYEAAGVSGAYMPEDNNPEDVNPRMTTQLGTENAASVAPKTREALIDSREESNRNLVALYNPGLTNRKTLLSEESLAEPFVGDRAVHYRVDGPQQQASEKAALSKEGESAKKQHQCQPLIVKEMPKQSRNAVPLKQRVASTLSDETECSPSVMASPRLPAVNYLPPLPSDSEWELMAANGPDSGRPSSPNLDAKWTADGLELKWNMDLKSCPNPIVKYEVYVCKVDVKGLVPWTKIGAIPALPLPMSCCLNNLERSVIYYFTVRAVDSKGVVGIFSSPQTAPQRE